DVHAALVKFHRIKLDAIRDDDHRWQFAAIRIQAQATDAACDHQANVAIAKFIQAAGAHDRLHDFGVSQRDRQQDGLGRVKQPVNVLFEFEDAAVVSANAFKYAVAVQQAVIEHGNLGVLLSVIFPVNVDFHL